MIKVEVHSTRAAIRSQEPLTVGLRGAKARFVFGADWDSLIKTAVFRQGEKTVTLADIGQEVTIPWEVLTVAGVPVQIGVYGMDAEGAVAIPTLWVSTQPVQPGADPEGDPSTEYSQPYWEQILQKTDGLANAIMEANRPVFSVTVSEREDGSNTADQDLQTILAKLDEGFSVTCYWYDKDVILPLINVHMNRRVAFAAVYDAMAYRVVIHQNGVQCTAVELAQKTDLPTKTSQLQNDSGYLTKAPVTGVNGQTGDVTIPTPIRVTIEQLADGSYQPDPPYDEIVEFHDQGNLLYCQYENLELPLTGVVPHFYTFSCIDGGKVHRVKLGPSSVTVSSENIASGTADAVCYTPQELTEEQKAQARENIGVVEVPETAEVGQTIVVKEVDKNGKPTALEAANFPSGGGDEWEELMNITTEEEVTKVRATLSNPGRFKMMSLYLDLRKSDTNTISLMVTFDVNNPDKWTPNNNYSIISIQNQGTTDTTHCCYVHFQPTHTMTNACNLLQGSCQWGATKFITADTVVSSVSVATQNNANVFGVGSIIKVYGVRA